MMKYLWHEIKKNLSAILIITGICTLIYTLTVSTMEMSRTYTYENWQGQLITNTNIYEPAFSLIASALGILCFFIPTLVFSFKMDKRAVDCYYALPLKKEKLYLAKTLLGLVMIIVPFTVAYWVGFLALSLREGNPYNMGYYVPAYFGMLLFAILLFGFNSFIFTRANKAGDGVAFMVVYAWLFAFVVLCFLEIFNITTNDETLEGLLTLASPAGMIWFDVNMGSLIVGGEAAQGLHWSAWQFITPILMGVGGYFGLFFGVRYEKAENAEQVSDSWFGYKVLIPLITALGLGIIGELHILVLAIIVVSNVIATVMHKRTFKLELWDWIRIGIGLLAGIILSLI